MKGVEGNSIITDVAMKGNEGNWKVEERLTLLYFPLKASTRLPKVKTVLDIYLI